MPKLVTLQFIFEDDELEEFRADNDINRNELQEWVFGEMCQNQGFGFLTTCRVEEFED